MPPTVSAHKFVAVWPINDMTHPSQLLAEAAENLVEVASRHRVRIVGDPTFSIRHGREIAGSQGSKYVVYCEVEAEQLAHNHWGGRTPLLGDDTPKGTP